jgi:hypothetical protein
MTNGRFVPLMGVLLMSACALSTRQTLSERVMAELWQEPADIAERNLLYGPGGRALLPDANASYVYLDVDKTGFSPGYDVRDPQGREWDVKLGPESQTEVVVARLLWAVGYHQPATYYLPRWTLTENGKATVQSGGRFRLKTEAFEDVGEWAWTDNPFIGTRPYEGLFVFMVMVNNWDLKPSQNAIYRVQRQGDDPRNLYVVKDLGASLGKTNWLLPGTRNDVEDFENERFIRRVEGNRVIFHYQGAWREPHVAGSAAPADVRWISNLLAKLSPEQWNDAFRAGGYSGAEAARYIRRLQEKIAEGQGIG